MSFLHIQKGICLGGLAMGAFWLLTACRTPAIEDQLAPSVSIESPQASAVFSSGDTIRLSIKLEDNDMLHDVQVLVRESESGFLRWTEIAHPHTDTMTFSGNFALETTEPLDFTLRVEASDHHENLVEQETSFSVHP